MAKPTGLWKLAIKTQAEMRCRRTAFLEGREINPVTRIDRDGHRPQVQVMQNAGKPKIGGRFNDYFVTGTTGRAERQQKRFGGADSDDEVLGF